jgi:hypothetical protein
MLGIGFYIRLSSKYYPIVDSPLDCNKKIGAVQMSEAKRKGRCINLKARDKLADV